MAPPFPNGWLFPQLHSTFVWHAIHTSQTPLHHTFLLTGGRNRKFLKEPIALDYKDNPEHGLRLILTFQPHTSFLVPIDRCVSLAKAGIFGGAATTAAAALAGVAGNVDKEGPFYKEQALKFLHVCLASVLNLRSPDELRQQGDAADQLASMLLAPPVAPNVRPVPARQELGGVKTKTQLVAERQVSRGLLVGKQRQYNIACCCILLDELWTCCLQLQTGRISGLATCSMLK